MNKPGGRLLYQKLIFLLSCAFLFYEIAVLREVRFQVNFGLLLTPVYFSSVLCLIGTGSILAGYLKSRPETIVRRAILYLTVLCYPSFLALNLSNKLFQAALTRASFFTPEKTNVTSNLAVSLFLAVVLGYGCIFVLQGVLYVLLFRMAREEGFLSKLYACDLVAAGLAAAASGFFSFYLSPANLVIAASFLFFAAFLLSRKIFSYRRRVLYCLSAVFILFLVFEFIGNASRAAESPAHLKRNNKVSSWSPYQKIDVVDNAAELCVYVDGWLYYTVPKPEHPFLKSDDLFLRLAHRQQEDKNTKILIVGSGLGRDVYALRRSEESYAGPAHKMSITAVELDGKVIEGAKKFPWLWEKYSTANIITGEGRYFLETSRETFDMVHYAYLDPLPNITNFAFCDANFLYTDRAIKRIREHLSPSGLFLIKRAIPVEMENGVIDTLCATLRSAGVSSGEVFIWVSKDVFSVPGISFKTLYVLAGKQPFSEQDRKEIGGIAVRAELAGRAWSEKNVRPTTDFYPFSLKDERVQFLMSQGFRAKHPVFAMAVLACLLALALRLASSLSMAHFFSIGLAFMLAESMVLFNSFLLTGNPSLSAGVVLGALLLSSGCGSFFSEYIERRKGMVFFLPLLAAIYSFVIPEFIASSMAMPKAARLLAYSFLILPLGFMMGTVFPISLRVFKGQKITRLFFINMVGCGISPIVFQVFFPIYGYYAIIFLTFGLYFFAVAIITFAKKFLS